MKKKIPYIVFKVCQRYQKFAEKNQLMAKNRVQNTTDSNMIHYTIHMQTKYRIIIYLELDLSNNKLRYLPSMLLHDFSDWQALQVLDIQVGCICTLCGCFQNPLLMRTKRQPQRFTVTMVLILDGSSELCTHI